MKSEKNNDNKITTWEITLFTLSIYVLSAIFIETVIDLNNEISLLLLYIDNIVCLVFISDFFYKLIKAESKSAYLKTGWIDLVSSIPNFQFLRFGRLARIFRLIRLLRGIRSSKLLLTNVLRNKSKSVFLTVVLISFFMIVISSIAILNAELNENSNINTASDALWWSFVTITTVGYGDLYPVTLVGRLVASVLMICGVGLFGTFTAMVSSFFLNDSGNNESEIKELESKINILSDKIDSLDSRLK